MKKGKYKTKHRKCASSGDAMGGKDRASARKWKKGGRVEAYTMGEALGKKGWP